MTLDTSMPGASSRPPRPISQEHATVKLPKLEIAKFTGDIRSWQGFWDQFDATINQNVSLSEIDKFKYLKSYLTAKAATAIEGLQLTGENYTVALDLLKTRFGKKELIVEEHMSRLLAVRTVSNSHNVEKLRLLYDEVETGVRSLEALGVSSNTYGTLLLTVLRKAVPSDLELEYHRKTTPEATNEVNDLKQFLNFLKSEIESRERTQHGNQRVQPTSSMASSSTGRNERPKRYPPSTAMFATGTNTNENQCLFCGSADHITANCSVHMPLDRKKRSPEREQSLLSMH
ncbi:uncharacterized protein LOC120838345 [Ixodes scapularis]|uniref:uncharacterized protein LOC120838345 n=1 Tax=Ixodes scapularis TaxID=6945 RepID=UPI001A9D755A|nr:uncharacterized protein LOC120838345 [Ixodes scapularis]